MDIKDKTAEQSHWSNFHGRGNSKEVLVKKARLLSAVILDWTHTGTIKLIELLEKDSKDKNLNEKFKDIFLESVIFIVHFTDRTAFQSLSSEQRSFFMNALMDEIASTLKKYSVKEEEWVDTSFLAGIFNDRNIEYSKYKIKAAENEALGGTLFWEFGKKITGIAGSVGVFEIQYVHICIIGILEFLRLPELFKE